MNAKFNFQEETFFKLMYQQERQDQKVTDIDQSAPSIQITLLHGIIYIYKELHLQKFIDTIFIFSYKKRVVIKPIRKA